jgi:hypothetical protein
MQDNCLQSSFTKENYGLALLEYQSPGLRVSIGLIFLFVYAFTQTKLTVFNIKLPALAAVCNNSLTHASQNNFTLFFNRKNHVSVKENSDDCMIFLTYNFEFFAFVRAMTSSIMNESQNEMNYIVDSVENFSS